MTTFLDVGDLASRWHTTAKAVYGMKHRGELPPAVRIGRRLLWTEADVVAFETGRREGSAKPTARPRSRTRQGGNNYGGWFKEKRPA